MELLSEAVDKIRKEKNSKLTFAFKRNGMDYWVSDPFKDKYYDVSLLMVVRKENQELIVRLPYVTIDKNDGFSSGEVKAISRFVKDDQLNIFKRSPVFMQKYGHQFKVI